MIDYRNLTLMRFHDAEPVEMAETQAPHHDAAAHDVERGIDWYRRVFRCTTCNEEVIVDVPRATSNPA